MKQNPLPKIIFLDIDGVLNSECTRGYFKHIEDEYVENLAYIIQETQAEIVLSSSWRRFLRLEDLKQQISLPFFEEPTRMLSSALEKYNITIRDFTPVSDLDNSDDSRPQEIREWLLKHNCENFVILDDDSAYNWGFLKYFFVSTYTIENNKPLKGLTREIAEKAITILKR